MGGQVGRPWQAPVAPLAHQVSHYGLAMDDLMRYFDESYVPPAMAIWEELILEAVTNGVHGGVEIHRYVGGNSHWMGEALLSLVERQILRVVEIDGRPSRREYFFVGQEGTAGQPAIVPG